MTTRSYGGFTPRGSNKKQAVPFDAPKEGSLDTEDKKEFTPTRGRGMVSYSPYSVGRDTLRQSKSISNAEVSPGRFYGSASSRLNDQSSSRDILSAGTPAINSLLIGTPTPARLDLRQSPPEEIDVQPQHRNASTRGAIRGQGQRTREAQKGNKDKVIEINIGSSGDEDDDVVETGSSRPRSSVKKTSARASGGSRSGSTTAGNQFGIAQINGPIRRKSDSPQDTRESTRWDEEGQGIRIILPALDEDRSFKISEQAPTFETGITEHSERPRPRHADKMKAKDGSTTIKPQLGSGMESSYRRGSSSTSVANVKEVRDKRNKTSEKINTLPLARIGFWGLAQFQDGPASPSVNWNVIGDVEIRWKQGDKPSSLIIQNTEILRFEYIDVNTTHGLCVVVKDVKNFVEKLRKKVDRETSDFLLSKSAKPESSIFLLPLTDADGRVSDVGAWESLLSCLKRSFATFDSLLTNTFFLLKSDTMMQRDLAEISQPISTTMLSTQRVRSQPRPRPSATSAAAHPEPLSRRSASQADTEGEAVEPSKASIEADTKVQAPTEPQKAMLSYPFESTGAVNVFRSDLDKLNDDEMLNDTIVELGLKYLLEEIKQKDPALYDQIYVFSSFFYKRINENKRDRKSAYEFVRKWTRKVDIFKKKYLVVPINEKMHWYLAIVTNPFYAVREIEKNRGLHNSADEDKEEEEAIEEDVDVADVDGVPMEGTREPSEAASLSNIDEAKVEQLETLGDTVMKEEGNRPTVEVVIPTSSNKSDRPGTPTDHMDLDRKDDGEEKLKLEMKTEGELLSDYTARKRTLRTTPVIDKRSGITPRPSFNVSDDESDEPVLIQSNSPKKAGLSQVCRPGFSDGITNTGKGTLNGGGGQTAISFGAGEIPEFRKEEEEERIAAKKRKAEEELQDMRIGSPPKSRSGATYGLGAAKSAAQLERKRETQEKHREWLRKKAVVCVFDSLASTHKAVRTALREYLWLEYNDKRNDKTMGEVELEDVELEHIDVVSPTQGNFCDCGLYLLHAFERFFNDPRKVMKKVIISRNRDDPYWQSEDATKKRQWWRTCIQGLIDEYQRKQAQVKAEKEARLALKSSSTKAGSEEKSKTSSPSDSSTSEMPAVETASAESSLEEPTVVKAT